MTYRTKSLLSIGIAILLAGLLGCERRDTVEPGTKTVDDVGTRPGEPATGAPGTTAPGTATPGQPGAVPPGHTEPGQPGHVPEDQQRMQEQRQQVTAMRQRVHELDRRIQELDTRIQQLGAQVKPETQRALQELRNQRLEAAQVLNQAELATVETWDDAKDKAQDAVNELENKYNEVLESLKIDN